VSNGYNDEDSLMFGLVTAKKTLSKSLDNLLCDVFILNFIRFCGKLVQFSI